MDKILFTMKYAMKKATKQTADPQAEAVALKMVEKAVNNKPQRTTSNKLLFDLLE